ncbi:hypothetical protein ACFL1H_04560 [Nanoarchaeota archaeon]
MTTFEIIKEESMNLSQLKVKLADIKKRDKELGFRALKTEEYINQLNVLDAKEADELFKKLEKLKIPRIKDLHMHKIIDILPVHIEDVKVMFQGYPITITNENLKKIIDTVKEFVEEN